jgi:hypothetical protein
MRVATVVSSFAAMVALGACVSTSLSQDEAKRLTEACRAEVGAVGSYSVRQGRGGVPEVFSIVGAYGMKDGTTAEAQALNACIKRKVSGNGVAAAGTTPVSGSCTKRSNPLQGGAGYC